MGYALNAGGSWTDDLLIVDTEDLKTMPPSEIHVKKGSNQKRWDIQKRNSEFVFPRKTG